MSAEEVSFGDLGRGHGSRVGRGLLKLKGGVLGREVIGIGS